LRANHGAIADLDVIDYTYLPRDRHMVANFGASGDACLCRHHRMFSDNHVVGDLHKIIDLSATPNYRLAQSRTIDRRVCANLNIIFHYHDTDLRDLDTVLAAAGIAEAVAANHHTRVQYHPITDAASLSDHHVGMKHTIGTDFDIVADKDPRVKRRAAANLGVGTNIDMRKNRNSVRDHRGSIDIGLGTAGLRERSRRRKQLKNLSERDVGIRSLKKRQRHPPDVSRCGAGANYHGAGPAVLQIFGIAGITEKGNLASPRLAYGRHPVNSHLAIANNFPTDNRRQFG